MSGSADLYRRLKNKEIMVDVSEGVMGGWDTAYITPGGTHECHPDYVATPIGDSPYGFLICQRKRSELLSDQKYIDKNNKNKGVSTPMALWGELPYTATPGNQNKHTTQSYNLYNDTPNARPSTTRLGGNPLRFQERRLPNQAHLQGLDYFRECIRYRGIGIENVDAVPGEFGYRENKYYYSTPPPIFDISKGVQPYALWKREQIRMGNFTPKQIEELEKQHTFANYNAVF